MKSVIVKCGLTKVRKTYIKPVCSSWDNVYLNVQIPTIIVCVDWCWDVFGLYCVLVCISDFLFYIWRDHFN